MIQQQNGGWDCARFTKRRMFFPDNQKERDISFQRVDKHRWEKVLIACGASSSNVAIGCPKYGSGDRDECLAGPPIREGGPVQRPTAGPVVESNRFSPDNAGFA